MKILTLNCNGIRSATSKGLLGIIRSENPDILTFQETKAPDSEIKKEHWREMGYEIYTCIAEKAGYSGVGTFTKTKPIRAEIGFGSGIFLSEGRSILLEYSNLLLWNLYFPSGTSGEIRQSIKYEFLGQVDELVKSLKKKKKPILICGDVNIAHQEIDIHNPKGNVKNSGFLPAEREWMTHFLSNGMIDCFREKNPNLKDTYSWWTYRANARMQNKGWRIDYILGSAELKPKLLSSKIISVPQVSDHAPVVLDFQFT